MQEAVKKYTVLDDNIRKSFRPGFYTGILTKRKGSTI